MALWIEKNPTAFFSVVGATPSIAPPTLTKGMVGRSTKQDFWHGWRATSMRMLARPSQSNLWLFIDPQVHASLSDIL